MPSSRKSRSPASGSEGSNTEASSPVELRPSPIQGKGAFATRWIRKGEKIIEYTGERISNAEADRRYNDDDMRRHHTFLFILTSRTIIDGGAGGSDARYINHSCDPNSEAVIYDNRRIWIEAIRDIAPGEELLYDYQYERTDDHTDEDEEFYVCRCGAGNCRGTILAPPRKERKPHHARVKSGARKGAGKRAASGKRPKTGSGPGSRGGTKRTLGKKSSGKTPRVTRTSGKKSSGKTPRVTKTSGKKSSGKTPRVTKTSGKNSRGKTPRVTKASGRKSSRKSGPSTRRSGFR
jgi:uncharacterized protein